MSALFHEVTPYFTERESQVLRTFLLTTSDDTHRPTSGFMEQREIAISQGTEVGPAALCFGCRNRNDLIYEQQITSWVQPATAAAATAAAAAAAAASVLSKFEVAFSRLEGSPKVYVQHLIKQQSEFVWDLLVGQKGALYICGNAKMVRDVIITPHRIFLLITNIALSACMYSPHV